MPNSPIDALVALVRQLAPVGDEAIRALRALTQPRRFDAASWLLEAGEPAHFCFFVTRGLVRDLYIDSRGCEHTRAFACAGQMSGSLLDLLSGQRSVTWVQALEPTSTLAWSYREFETLCERHPELNTLARRVAESLYVQKAQREHQLLALPAADRYALWWQEHSELDARVNGRVLASYLGITPEHLSRLRRSSPDRSRSHREIGFFATRRCP